MTEEVKVKLEEASLKIPSKAKLTQETCQHMFSSLKSGGQYQVCKISVPWKYILEEERNRSVYSLLLVITKLSMLETICEILYRSEAMSLSDYV